MRTPVGSLTDVSGIRVGHYTDPVGVTGCTVILCEAGAAAAVDVRGGAPATRETDLLRPGNLVQRVHALLLTGGSAFGLDAAAGVMRFLEERGVGFATSAGSVPIVPAAALFDLGIGSPAARPGPDDAYAACVRASAEPGAQGSVGAGTGATVGHLGGMSRATKGGIGAASRRLANGVTVAALAAVNAFGDVRASTTNRILAGTRVAVESRDFHDTTGNIEDLPERRAAFREHTTLAVVATDASFDRAALVRVAAMAHDGLARAISPAHTAFDGDLVFALSTGAGPVADGTVVGTVAAELLAAAIVRGVLAASSLGGVPAAGEGVA
jgi:L-aminopeptidase/D-esterase-like protein